MLREGSREKDVKISELQEENRHLRSLRSGSQGPLDLGEVQLGPNISGTIDMRPKDFDVQDLGVYCPRGRS